MKQSMQESRRGRAFTLLELMVVVALIGVLALTALPSIIAMFTSGTDAQAYNVVTTLLATARSEAIRNNTYVAVHIQRRVGQLKQADGSYKFTIASGQWYHPGNATYAGLFFLDPASKLWKVVPGTRLSPLPGSMTVGEVSDTYFADPAGYKYLLAGADEAFTTVTVIFAPNGSVVRQVNGANIDWERTSTMLDPAVQALFSDSTLTTLDTNPMWIWASVPPSVAKKPGCTAIVLFDWQDYLNATPVGNPTNSRAKLNSYLTANGQYIPINTCTGHLAVERR